MPPRSISKPALIESCRPVSRRRCRVLVASACFQNRSSCTLMSMALKFTRERPTVLSLLCQRGLGRPQVLRCFAIVRPRCSRHPPDVGFISIAGITLLAHLGKPGRDDADQCEAPIGVFSHSRHVGYILSRTASGRKHGKPLTKAVFYGIGILRLIS